MTVTQHHHWPSDQPRHAFRSSPSNSRLLFAPPQALRRFDQPPLPAGATLTPAALLAALTTSSAPPAAPASAAGGAASTAPSLLNGGGMAGLAGLGVFSTTGGQALTAGLYGLPYGLTAFAMPPGAAVKAEQLPSAASAPGGAAEREHESTAQTQHLKLTPWYSPGPWT